MIGAPKGEKNGRAKFTARKVRWIRKLLRRHSHATLAARFKVSTKTIARIDRGETYV